MKETIKSKVNKVLDFFKIDKNNKESLKSGALTNKVLLQELATHFEQMLLEESVGKRMLYPMSFNILMVPEDYNSRCGVLKFILPQVVEEFYEIIKKMKEKYPVYTPPALYWTFQFSAFPETDGDEAVVVRKGHITTMASLSTIDVRKGNNVKVDSNVRVSVKVSNTNVERTNVNMDAITDMEILGGDLYTFDFDPTLNDNPIEISNSSNISSIDGIAELSYSLSGYTYRYTMCDTSIMISGKNDLRQNSSIFKIESENIIDSHILIKYEKDTNKFKIATFGIANLNTRKMEVSKGGEVKWYELPNKSSIFVNNEVSVKFEIK